MRGLSISSKLGKIFPNLALGVVSANVKVGKGSPELWGSIEKESTELIKELSLDRLPETRGIKELRDAYKKLGKSPSRYRGSAEALFRRLLKGKDLYRVNNIVDINNYVSIKSKHSVGSYNTDSLKFPVEFRIGRVNEEYKGIGKGTINISSLPVFSDLDGPYGSPTSDSEKAMITDTANNIMMVVISFSGEVGLNEYLDFAENLLVTYAEGIDISRDIVK